MSSWPGKPLAWIAFLVLACAVGAVSVVLAMNESQPNRVSFDVPASHLHAAAVEAAPVPPPITHIPTPEAVKSVYITACTASEAKLRDKVVDRLAGTEVNAMVIDLKDYTGTLSYASTTVAVPPGGRGCRIIDLPYFVQQLHDKGIYAIGRVTVFQDPLYSKAHPDLAVASKSHPDHPWTDKNGLAYIDPDHKGYWDYIVDIAKEAHSIGFDEINFDYIRFPSDGDMSDARFDLPASTTRLMAIKAFYSYLHDQLTPAGITTSADIFGQTTVNTDDLGIGQVLENTLPYFDYVAPMVYPSHFINGFMDFSNPGSHPYEVIKFTMTRAVERAVAASTSPDKLRPWLQAFDYKAIYTPDMVQAEKRATYDSGLSAYMLWNAASEYNVPELMPAPPVAPITPPQPPVMAASSTRS